MICLYCNKPVKYKSSYNYLSHYETYNCLNHSKFLDQIEFRMCNSKLERIMMDNINLDVTVYLYLLDNKTFVYYYNKDPLSPYMTFNFILSISPENFNQKLSSILNLKAFL